MKKLGIVIAALFAVGMIGSVCSNCGKEPEKPKTAEQLHEEEIGKCFSQWDGSHVELAKSVKNAMNDPSSYEHVETRYLDKKDGTLLVTMKFRGNNAFGGKVLNAVNAITDLKSCQILKVEQ